MVIVALDTSSAAGSAAVARDGRVVVARPGDASRTHGERLPGELMAVLDAAGISLHDVDLFAVAIGPGSFTGLRVGIATIQGLALAGNRRVVPVTTFEAIAFTHRGAPVGVWIDARRGEVFAALFDADGVMRHEPVSLAPDAALDVWARDLEPRTRLVGDGAVLYADLIRTRRGAGSQIAPPATILASAIANIAHAHPDHAVAPHALNPLYVRRSDAELARDRRRDAAGDPS